MKITPSERTVILQLLQEMVYTASEAQFLEKKSKIITHASANILDYLNNHWFSIHDEWCPRIGTKTLNFMNTINNWLEGINAKLK